MESLKRKIRDEIEENDRRSKRIKKGQDIINKTIKWKEFYERKYNESKEKEKELEELIEEQRNESYKFEKEMRKFEKSCKGYEEVSCEKIGEILEENETDKTIYNLSNEIIGEIFKKLEIQEKVRFGATCKWINDN